MGSVADVEYVSLGGMQLPFYQDHHLRTLSPAQLREHAMLLYRTIGYAGIGEVVPLSDIELHAWIMRVHGLHLQPLLVSGGLGVSSLGATGSTRMLGSAGIVRGAGVVGSSLGASGRVLGASSGARVLGSAGVVGGTIGGSAGVRSAGAARVIGGGVSGGLAARSSVVRQAGSVTDDLFNVVDRNHDGKISRSEFRSGVKTGLINRGPAAVRLGR